MVKRLAAAILFGWASLTFAQSPVDFANLREDVQGLSQKVGDLTLRIEQLEHDLLGPPGNRQPLVDDCHARVAGAQLVEVCLRCHRRALSSAGWRAASSASRPT